MSWRVRHENPAWLDTAVTRGWSRILRESRGVPLVQRRRSGRLHVEELGCGNYGCVLPTDRPEIVVKVTVDKSEARFVALTLRSRALRSAGLTKYYALERLPGARKLDWDQKPRAIYALWRAAAHDVGRVELALFRRTIPRKLRRELDDFIVRATRFRDWASELQDIDLDREGYLLDDLEAHQRRRPAAMGKLDAVPGSHLVSVDDRLVVRLQAAPKGSLLRAGSLLAACRTEATLMASYAPYAGGLVGQTLLDLISDDIVLADVHAGNLGRLEDGPYGKIVIVDPGHAVFLRRKVAARAEECLGGHRHARKPNPMPANVVSLAAYQRS